MADLTSPPTRNTQPAESPSLPHLVLDLDLQVTPRLPKPSDCCDWALCPSTQSNLLKLRASLLICDPSLPSQGIQTTIAWWREQLLAAWQRLDERNRMRHTTGMIPITQTMSQIIDTVLDATVPWSIAMDTTPQIRSQYQHHSHPYLSDPPTHHIKKWPEFTSCMRTLLRWQLKLPDLSTKTMKIPSKYQHPLSSQQMKGLPKGWAYVKDDVEGRQEGLRDPSQYGHLPPQLTHVQQQLEQARQSNHPMDSSTISGRTSSPSPSPTNMECRHQPGSSKSI